MSLLLAYYKSQNPRKLPNKIECIMQLVDFMYYPDHGCRLAMMRPYEWRGRRTTVDQHRVQFLLGALNLFYQNLGLIIDLFLAETQEKRLSEFLAHISETCSVMALTLIAASYLWILLYKRRDIESILDEFQCLYPQNSDLYRLEHYYKKSTRLMKYLSIYFLTTYLYYNLLPFTELTYELLIESQHVKYNTQSNTWYPWNLLLAKKSSIRFAISYLSQALASLSGIGALMTSQFLLCFFTTQMQLHFDALANGFNTLDARQPEANEKLKDLIIYHCRLLHVVNKINQVFNFMFLSTFSISTIAICLMAIAMITIDLASAFKYSAGLMFFVIFTFFICYSGTQFTAASDKLTPAALYTNWYEGDKNFRRMLLIFIMRSRESQVLRIYKFTPVSMDTYMNIVKFSSKLFTFFRAMIN